MTTTTTTHDERGNVTREWTLCLMCAFAVNHGFTAHVAIAEDCVNVQIPYVASNGQAGAMWAECRTWDQLRAELGY